MQNKSLEVESISSVSSRSHRTCFQEDSLLHFPELLNCSLPHITEIDGPTSQLVPKKKGEKKSSRKPFWESEEQQHPNVGKWRHLGGKKNESATNRRASQARRSWLGGVIYGCMLSLSFPAGDEGRKWQE